MNFKQNIDSDIFHKIGEEAGKRGLRAYLIGGYVRDLILDRPSKDVDIVVVRETEDDQSAGIELAKAIANLDSKKRKLSIYKNFGTAALSFDEWHLEFVGARKESYRSHSRNPEVQAGSLIDDQRRRDFTINALSIGLNEDDFGNLHDPFDGLADLEAKIIKTPLEPEQTFSDDPLRMLRAIRFSGQLGFKISEHTLQGIKEQSHRVKIVAPERVAEEVNKMLLCNKPSVPLALLEECGIMNLILPEITALKGVEEVEGKSHKDNFFHTLQVVDNISRNTQNLWLRWTAFLHDIGKPVTKRFDEKVGWTFHAHEFVGSKMVPKIFKRLHLPLNEKMKFVRKLVMLSSRPVVLSQEDVTDSAVRRLLFDAQDDIDGLMTLCEADITTKNKTKMDRYLKNFRLVRSKLKEVEERDRIRNWQPPISGEEIMQAFGIKPSKAIGDIKNSIKEAILNGEVPNDKAKAWDFMIKKGEEMGLTPQVLKPQ